MGCSSTKIPEPESEEEEENGSDFLLFPSENAVIDEVKVEKTLTYPDIVPVNDNCNIKSGTDVKWFSNWTPQMKDDVEDLVEFDSDMPEPRTQQDVDKHARQAPAALNNSFTNLITYLTGDLDNSDRPEVFKARALMVWLSIQDVDSKEVKRKEGNTDTPDGYITLLAQKRTTYSTVFLVLCLNANIKCKQIEGVGKSGGYQPGDTDLGGLSTWNAIFVEGSWHLVHPFLICRCIVGGRTGGWIKLEAGSNTERKQELKTTVGMVKNAFEEYYFMTNPSEFIYMCHPSDERWQLLQNTVTRPQFIDKAYLLPPFFGLGLRLKTKDACVYEAQDGEVMIKIDAPAKNANAINMYYEFLLKEESNAENNSLLSMETRPRLVSLIRCGERWKIRVRFPIKGTFKLRIFGAPNNVPLLLLGEFRLDCPSPRKECLPLPIDPKEVGFGPGPFAERSGLLFPSHRDGQYPVYKDKEMRFTFHLEEEAVRFIHVRNDLVTLKIVNGRIEKLSLASSVQHEIHVKRRELSITCKIIEDGEYVLSIATATAESPHEYRTVCNYLLSSDITPRRENTHLRIARNKLREVLSAAYTDESKQDKDVIKDIEEAIEKCRKHGAQEDDEEIESAKIRLEYLRTKQEIREAKLRQNWYVTEKTVRRLKQSRFAHIFRKNIQELSKERDILAVEREQTLDRRERRRNFNNYH
ncbi:hillarin-like [Argopecten irradians]|uniref:hillarin-like n=1 Tax=Argopecten irradians TaxID=31199 RepID=UPI00371B3F71